MAPMPTRPDFRLYHSNALEVLAGLLADALRTPAPGQSLLAPDIVLIPQPAMRRWLQATLAQAHGIAANIEFLTPGEFVQRALDANVAGAVEDLDTDAMRWQLYAMLRDPAALRDPALHRLRDYLDGDDALKPWSLAGELAAVFEKYLAWRRDWLLGWEAGRSPRDPQAVLWRRIATGRAHRARRIDDYLARFAGDDAPLPTGLPSRLCAFATLNVSPDVLRVIATQARFGVLHFYLPTPTRAYWGDLPSLRERLRNDAATAFDSGPTENPLLQAWGAAGRDFMAVLGNYEVVHPAGEIAAYADPEQRGSDDPAVDTLLQRLQRDLLHRRPSPVEPWRAQVDRSDNSLQVHACHTRLREVQVLHDQLRGLLEDASIEGRRFDPPLQPREIAVLAPDIDLYAPYIEAVFGGVAGTPAFIPYALADASPLGAEPLAEVFLRLLALPISRFGLDEILDLLATPAIGAAAGLDAPGFERLRGWLHGAGARWGIDAAHRERNHAPRDDAYTWTFALDRLLLGHASGADGDIAGLAPYPELEGSALDALDALIRLLRVLARHQRVLGEAMSPAQWRERLFGLLDALLPQTLPSPTDQGTLERLRALIAKFADDARRAGFDGLVPPEVLRAHFASTLAQADTRAPLLSGGVSFGRMVPMRLLPFRVICVLGMNDGDYPRRDPAAGLNQLTRELTTSARRPGDRSLRDDDRFLFLQLFAAAADVFYLSYLGADPRDGSAREPSVLVSELLAAAGAYHADPDEATQDLVLRHPLQPFSPTAFGSDDTRHFSYREHWHHAAARLSGARTTLAPWMDAATALAPPLDVETELSLDALRRFLMAPAEQFLRQRLGLRLTELDAAGEDVEPLQAPGRGLERNQLQRAVFDALLAGVEADAMHPVLRARGLLPSGPLGRRALAEVLGEVRPYAQCFAQWRGEAQSQSLPLEVEIDGLRLHGRIVDIWPQGIARLRFGERNGPSAIRHGLDWLLANAVGVAMPFIEFHDDKERGIGPYPREVLSRDVAIDALRRLLVLRAEGLRRPLSFAPYSGWELFKANDAVRGPREAAKRWRGGARSWAEGDGEALRLALRGRDPFADGTSLQDFVDTAYTIYGAVMQGRPAAPPDGFEPPADNDAEDAE